MQWVILAFMVAFVVFASIDNRRTRQEVRRVQLDMATEINLLRSSVEELASRTNHPMPPKPATVELTPVTEQMIGTWATDDTPVLTVRKVGVRVVISMAPNDTWRDDFHDARLVGDSIHFVNRSYLHSREFHPHNGRAHAYFLRLDGPDVLLYGSADEPDEVLNELTGGEPLVDKLTRTN